MHKYGLLATHNYQQFEGSSTTWTLKYSAVLPKFAKKWLFLGKRFFLGTSDCLDFSLSFPVLVLQHFNQTFYLHFFHTALINLQSQ